MARFLWTQKQDVGPSARSGHAMAYDAARGRTLIFGGDAGGGAVLGDSWSWDGEYWTQVADIGPSARAGHAMAFDAARNVILLFGGMGMHHDSWTWSGADWTQVEDSGPAGRYGHALAFDAARGRVILFGGATTLTTLVNDTWAWDGNAWTQVEDTGPAPRRHAALAWDGPRQRLILFGGEAAPGSAFADTWAWDGNMWTQIEDVGPPAAIGAAMCAGETGLVLFGGISGPDGGGARTVFDDSWVFDGTHWTQRQDIGPTPRWGHAMVRDAARGALVLFGGASGIPGDAGTTQFGDTWEHMETEAGQGTSPAPEPAPDAAGSFQTLTLQPGSAQPGTTITATIVLTGLLSDSIQLTLFWMEQSQFDEAISSGTGIDAGQVLGVQSAGIPPNVEFYTVTFSAPSVTGQIAVVASGDDGSVAVAQLQVS